MPDIALLHVLLHQRRIGTIARLPGDKNLFSFEQDYIDDVQRSVLSLSFKDMYGGLITDVPRTQTRLPPFFSNLLPEGRMREYLAAQGEVNPVREFLLLWLLGRDLPGALAIHPADGESWPPDAAQETGSSRLKRNKKGALRFSLAGVQLKFSAVKHATGGLTIPAEGVGGSWIVKLPSMKFNRVPENEFSMMELARRVGIDVPETGLVPITEIENLPKGIEQAGDTAFIIKRFDRSEAGAPIHMEDFAQVFGVYPDKKYEKASYQSIARVIWSEIGEPGIAEFVRRFVFNALIGNADMHLKNWALVYPDQRKAALAPAYDFVATIPYLSDDSLALSFAGSKRFEDVSIDAVKRFAAKAKLPAKLVLDTTLQTIDAFAGAWKTVGDLPLDPKVRAAIMEHFARVPLWSKR